MEKNRRIRAVSRRILRGLYLISAVVLYAGHDHMRKQDGNNGWNHIFPILIEVEGSLNVHSCVADYLVASLRDLTYVTYDQVLPEKIVFPVCDSISGPYCPHLRFPPQIPDSSGPSKSSFAGKNRAPDSYSAHLHRPLILGNSDSGAPLGGPPALVPLDTSRTFLHVEPLTVSRARRHSIDTPYMNKGHYLEDGIGDVAAQSLSDAVSNAIGHLGALTMGTGDIWGPQTPPPADSFVCFHSGNPRDRRDCHDLRGFSSLPSKYEAEVAAYHSGWSGSSHLLLFDRSRAPFIDQFLETDYSMGLPEAETRWRGRWRVMTHDPSEKEEDKPLNVFPLPLTGPLAESFTAQPASYDWVLNRRGPPQPIHTYVRFDSQEGSFFHSNVFVPYGIWVSAVPRVPSPNCKAELVHATRKLVLFVHGIQDEENIFTIEVPLYDILGLHAADSDVAKDYRFVNALDFLKTTPLQRVDMLRFTYGVAGSQGSAAEPVSFRKPLECSSFFAVLGGLHILVAEKTISNKVYYSVDATTPEGMALKEKAHAGKKQQQQQAARKEALAEKREPFLEQTLGHSLPSSWKVYKRAGSPLTTTELFDGSETTEQKESGYYTGVVVRSHPDRETCLYTPADISKSDLPVSWQENHRIKFGRFDAMANQFADLRSPLNTASLYLQDIPAEAPVLSLNQLQQGRQVFFRKPVFESHGRFSSIDGGSGGIGDLRSLMKSILKTLGGKGGPSSAKAAPLADGSILEKLVKKVALAAPPSPPRATTAAAAAAAPRDAAASPPPAAAVADKDTAKQPKPSQRSPEDFVESLTAFADMLSKNNPGLKDFLDRMSSKMAASALNISPPSSQRGGPSAVNNGGPSAVKGGAPAVEGGPPAAGGRAQKGPLSVADASSSGDDEKVEKGEGKVGPSVQQSSAAEETEETEETADKRAKVKGPERPKRRKQEKDLLATQETDGGEIHALFVMGPDGEMIQLGGPGDASAGPLGAFSEAISAMQRQMNFPADAEAAVAELKNAFFQLGEGGPLGALKEVLMGAPKDTSNGAPKGLSTETPKGASKGGPLGSSKGTFKASKEERVEEEETPRRVGAPSEGPPKGPLRTSIPADEGPKLPPRSNSSKNSSSSSSSKSSSRNGGGFSPPAGAEGLLEQATRFMAEADPSVLKAILKTAEAQARQILTRAQAGGGPQGGGPPGGGPPGFPPASMFADLLKAMPMQMGGPLGGHSEEDEGEDEL